MNLSVVILAKDEAENLSLLLPCLHEVLRREGLVYEILVVDGGSADDTVARATALGARAIRQSRAGYGEALKLAFGEAKGEYIATMDADYSHDPYFLTDLYRQRTAASVTVASRYVAGGYSEADWLRSTLSRILNATFRRVLSIPVLDLSSGFRLYHRRVFSEISIESSHFEALEEILIKIHGQGFLIREVPFHYRARARGVSKARILGFGWRLFKTLFKLWRLRNRLEWSDYDDRAFHSRVFLQRYWQRTRYRIVMDLLGRSRKVLDIGCGSSYIMQGLPQGVGLDLHRGKLRYLQARGRAVVQGSVYALPFRDGSFDQLIFSQVIEHIPAKPQIMAEISRVLRRGGILVIGTPDYSRLFWNILEWFYGKISPGAYAHEHISHYTMATLRQLLERWGFDVERDRYVAGAELNIRARKR